MKILAFSDVHLDSTNDPTSIQEELQVLLGSWIADQIKATDPDLVVNCGDTNHRDGGMSTGTISLFKRFFDPILSVCHRKGIQLYNLVGNHDQYTRNGALHVMEPLGWSQEAVVIAEPYLFEGHILDILFVPYQRDGLSLPQFNVKPDLVFTHADVRGMKMNSGVKSSHGLTEDPYDGVEVFNGHYHMPQNLGKVTVIGAPQYTQYRDVDPFGTPKRGIVLIEKDKGKPSKVTRITNPYTQHFAKFVGKSVDDLDQQFVVWSTSMKNHKVYKYANTNMWNLWFVGPKSVIDEYAPRVNKDEYHSVRMTTNDKVKTEETAITIDLSPETAIEQYYKTTLCTCCTGHDLDLGKSILREAQAYTVGSKERKQVDFMKLEIDNFMSVKHAEIELAGQGLTLIEGINHDDPTVESNGAGKSALAEALVWALFDKTARGIGKDEVIRRPQKDPARVQVTFRIGAETFVVSRSRAKGKPLCTVFRNGCSLTPHDQREVNALIESLLGVNFEQFLLMVVFAQGFDTKFSSFSDSDRKEVLESFLGIEIYEQARSLAAAKVKDLQAEKSKAETTIIRTEQAAATAAENLEAAQASLAQADQQDRSQQEELEKAISDMSGYVSSCAFVVAEAQKDRNDCFKALSDAREALSRARSRAAKGTTLIEAQSALIESLVERMRAVAEDGSTCETCGQPLPVHMQAELDQSAHEDVRQAQAHYDVLQATLREVNTEISQLEESCKNLEIDYQTANDTYTGLEATLRGYESQLRGFEQQHKKFDTSKTDVLRSMVTTLNVRIMQAKEEWEKALMSKISLDSKIHLYEYWVSAFDPTGVRSVILRTVVNYVNEYLHEMCGIVTGGSYLVQLSSTKELKTKKEAVNKLDIVITPDGSYKAGSGGERRKIDLLLNLAVARLAKQTSGFAPNILFADEVLDNLDLTASQHVLQMFDTEAAKGVSVFLISHNPSVKPLIPNVITVVKKNGESEILNA